MRAAAVAIVLTAEAKGYGDDDTVGKSYSGEPMADKNPCISPPTEISGYTRAMEMPASHGHLPQW